MKFSKDQTLLIAAEIPGQTWPSELGWLYSSVESSTRHLEIGTYAGRSLFVASHGMSSGEIYTVDDRKEDTRGIPLRFLKEQTAISIGHCYENIKVSQVELTSFEAGFPQPSFLVSRFGLLIQIRNQLFSAEFICLCGHFCVESRRSESWGKVLNCSLLLLISLARSYN